MPPPGRAAPRPERGSPRLSARRKADGLSSSGACRPGAPGDAWRGSGEAGTPSPNSKTHNCFLSRPMRGVSAPGRKSACSLASLRLPARQAAAPSPTQLPSQLTLPVSHPPPHPCQGPQRPRHPHPAPREATAHPPLAGCREVYELFSAQHHGHLSPGKADCGHQAPDTCLPRGQPSLPQTLSTSPPGPDMPPKLPGPRRLIFSDSEPFSFHNPAAPSLLVTP